MTLKGTFTANCDMPGCEKTLSTFAKTETQARKYFKGKGWVVITVISQGQTLIKCPECVENMRKLMDG